MTNNANLYKYKKSKYQKKEKQLKIKKNNMFFCTFPTLIEKIILSENRALKMLQNYLRGVFRWNHFLEQKNKIAFYF